ncbi:unnamed protein product, partial [Musa acuminata subsp. burmannicoides]
LDVASSPLQYCLFTASPPLVAAILPLHRFTAIMLLLPFTLHIMCRCTTTGQHVLCHRSVDKPARTTSQQILQVCLKTANTS